MKKIKPTNETGKNPETEEEKEALPSFFTNLFSSASTCKSQYRRLQGDDEGGQENGRGHQAPATLHHTQRAVQR